MDSVVASDKKGNSTSSRQKAISTNALRSKAMYSNCVMQAPDGQVLCVCDVKKAQWYCEKELAGNLVLARYRIFVNQPKICYCTVLVVALHYLLPSSTGDGDCMLQCSTITSMQQLFVTIENLNLCFILIR